MFRKRKVHLEGMLSAESAKIESQARFIVEKIEGILVIGMLLVCALSHGYTYICSFNHASACMPEIGSTSSV